MGGKVSSYRFLTSAVRPLYEFLYPRLCLVCDASLVNSEFKVCASCWTSVRPVVKSGELYRRQLLRLAELGCVSGLISAYHFEKDGTLQSLIHHLKYSGMTTVGIVLGRRLGGMSMKEMTGVAVSGIIPVPLHRIKERERGYNQSVFLAKGLSEVTGFPVLTEVLVRHKHTVSQTQLTMEKRLANVSDAFSLRSGMSDTVKGKRFIILDDVLTTGATIGSCAKALVGGGAVSVVACTVALAE